MSNHTFTGRPSVDKPWLKYYSDDAIQAELPDCTMFDYLWECNKDNLDDIAINYFDRKIAYRELFENIEKTTQAFASIGVNHGDSVLIVSVTLPEVIYSIYALNRLGAIANMVDPRTSVEGIQHYAKESNAKYMLAIDALGSKSEEIVVGTDISKIVLLSPADSLSPLKRFAYQIKERPYKTSDSRFYTWKSFQDIKTAIAIPEREYRRDDCAVIVHTGGTTGTPKGVMLSDYNLNSTVIQVALSGFNIHRKDKWLNIMPPFIAYGIGNGMHFPLCIGMELILIPMFDPKKYDSLLLKYKPAHMAGVPSHYDSVIHSNKLANLDMSFLLSPVVGGDGMDTNYEKLVNDFLNSRNCPTNLIKGYGMTEICAAVCAASRMEYNKLGSVGIPFSHSVVSIFDQETGEEMTYGQEGEICMQGPHIMLGYHNNQEETSKVLRTHQDGSVWLHSGDLGYMDEDGCIFVRGRIKRMIVRHDGFKVFPSLIESVVSTHPEVKQCCAVGIKDDKQVQGKLPVVFVVPKSQNASLDELREELEELCRKELPEYAQPIRWHFQENLQLTAIGKVDYRALEKMAEEIRHG